jgi:two-component system cell cycle sensor histidine kinase/response regulator CckA
VRSNGSLVRHLTSPLRLRLLGVVGIAVVPVAALVAQLTVTERRANLERARERAERLLDSTLVDQEDLLRSGRELARLLAQFPEIANGDSEHCSVWLSRLINAIPSYEFAARITADGSVDCSTDPKVSPEQLSAVVKAFLREPGDVRGLEYYRNHGPARPVATILESLPAQPGRPTRYILVDIRLRWPAQLAAALPARNGNVVVLADSTGRDYARIGGGSAGSSRSGPHQALRLMASALPAGYLEARGGDSVRRLYVYRRLPAANPAPVFFYIGQPVSAVYGDASEHLWRNALVAIISLALASFLAWFAADRLVLRDINTLLQATARLSEGDLSVRVPLPRSGSEIRDLAVRFNVLARSLEERRREFLVLGDSSPDAIVRVDRNFGVEWVNATALARAGLGPDALSGKSLGEAAALLRLPDEVGDVVRESFATGQLRERELRIGEPPNEAWLDVRAVPERARGAKAGYVLLIARDVSERKRLEAQVAQAERLESIGKLAGGVAHDFNNLLTAIIGNAEIALRALEPAHRARAEVQEIRDVGKRASALVRQLLTFARRKPAQTRVVDINRFLSNARDLLRRIAGPRVNLELELGSDLPNVRFDPTQLEQVLVNLVSNARDAMPQGGKLRLTTSKASAMRTAPQGAGTPAAGYVVLSVSDSGCGMPEAVRTRIFEPFFTTKANRGGTGLGLAVVYGLVRQHGGYIEVSSEVGLGTVFDIYFPGTREEAIEFDSDSPGPDPGGGHETVLLVEDRDAVRSTVGRQLRGAGYAVIECSDGAEVIEQSERGVLAAPDLVVTDLAMPRMDGEELVLRLRSMWPKVPVVIITGFDARATGRRIVESGLADCVLEKPFESGELLGTVRRLLDARAAAGRS